MGLGQRYNTNNNILISEMNSHIVESGNGEVENDDNYISNENDNQTRLFVYNSNNNRLASMILNDIKLKLNKVRRNV